MAIFGNTNLGSNYEVPAFEGAMPTMEYSDQALYEFAEDIYKIQAGLYVSDIMLEEAIMTESNCNPEALLENVFTDMFAKIKDALKKLWAKITGWFKEVRKHLEIVFGNGVTVVKKYENELKERAKNAKDYEYTGYVYDIAKFDSTIDKWSKAAEDKLAKLDGVSGDTYDAYASKFGDLGTQTTDDFSETLIKGLTNKASNMSELKEELLSIARSDADRTEKIIGFKGNSVTEMIDFVKNNSKALAQIDKDKSATDKRFNEVIKGYDKLEKSLADKKIEGITKLINQATSNAKFCLSVCQNLNNCRQQIYKEAFGTYVRALKGLLTSRDAKPAKEGFTNVDSSSSILESAMRLV